MQILRRQFAWNVKAYLLRKIRELFQNVACWNLASGFLTCFLVSEKTDQRGLLLLLFYYNYYIAIIFCLGSEVILDWQTPSQAALYKINICIRYRDLISVRGRLVSESVTTICCNHCQLKAWSICEWFPGGSRTYDLIHESNDFAFWSSLKKWKKKMKLWMKYLGFTAHQICLFTLCLAV